MEYTPITWNADDAQFIESQQLTVAQIALMFGLHPSDLDASVGGSGLTYANRADNILERVAEAYTPVMLPIEQAWSRLIPGKNFVRGNVEALLRSTTMQRYEAHALAQQIGLETEDETRAIEGKPPAPKEDLQPPVANVLPIAPDTPALNSGPISTEVPNE
jgi:phage portal protein BeeE